MERALPLIACVNKLDKDRASFLRAIRVIRVIRG